MKRRLAGPQGRRFTCTFISQSQAATLLASVLRSETGALRSFRATPQRIKCIHPDPRYRVRPMRKGQRWSSHSRADKQKRRIQKRFCLLHFIARAQGEEREREIKRGGERKGVKNEGSKAKLPAANEAITSRISSKKTKVKGIKIPYKVKQFKVFTL